MKIRIAICTLTIAMMTTSASATLDPWGTEGDWCNWDDSGQSEQDWGNEDWDTCLEDYEWGSYHDWENEDREDRYERKKKKKERKKNKKKGKHNDTHETPVGVPSPTAALSGLALAGLLMSRRRTRQD